MYVYIYSSHEAAGIVGDPLIGWTSAGRMEDKT